MALPTLVSLSDFATSDRQITSIVEGLYGEKPGYDLLVSYNEFVASNGIPTFTQLLVDAHPLADDIPALAAATAANFGVNLQTASADNVQKAIDFLTAQFTNKGIAATIKKVALNWSKPDSDPKNAIWKDAADTFKANTLSSLVYSTDVENTDPEVGSNVGEIFTLTDAADVLEGTSEDDTFYGLGKGTLSGSDIIDGGEGTDTLTFLADDGSTALISPVLADIEIINMRIDDKSNNVEMDLADATGYTELWMDRDNDIDSQMAFTNINSADVKLGARQMINDTDINYSFASGVLAGDNDTLTFEVNGMTDNDDVVVGGVDVGEGFETVNLISSGSVENDIEDFYIADNVDENGTGTNYTMSTLNISGSADLDIYVQGFLVDANGNSVATVDASAFTGDLDLSFNEGDDAGDVLSITSGSGDDILDADDGGEVTFDSGAGDDEIFAGSGDNTILAGEGNDTIETGAGDDTVDGGAGDDYIEVAGNLTVDDSIDGGADRDTIATTTAAGATIEASAAILATLSNFEVLAITNGATNAVDLTTWGVDTLDLEDAAGANLAVTMSSGNTIKISDNSGTATEIDAVVEGASDSGSFSDVVNVAFEADYNGVNNVTVSDMSVDFVETVNISAADTDATSAGTGTMSLNLTDESRVATINVTGDQNVTVTAGATLDALNTVDANSLTGALTIDVSTATQGVVITAGTGDDDVTASSYSDSINLGDGDNTYTATAGADAVTIGSGANTLVFASGTSTEASMASITGFNAVEAAADADEIQTVDAVIAVDVTGVDVSGADADAGATDIDADVTDGILTISGADAGLIDTLAEWMDVVETSGVVNTTGNGLNANVAFEFSGNTYLVERDETGGGDVNTDVTLVAVELVGVTGVTAIDTVAAADTILIA